ncbi:26S proteasome non-ATPase regulatory subunit 11 homolog [Coffea eugenioides]|uniref:26S proteasome non-ATPase regulatory subunit 11 homolog n=1 Tax=Coffea eugenioides TaxID=49369 RepID=UPI000F6066CC|nr:26S proteasome non-ATPase regulatory subunit 11 homolog [Coffea eugenioides]
MKNPPKGKSSSQRRSDVRAKKACMQNKATTTLLTQASEATSPSEPISIYYHILANLSSSPEALTIKKQPISNLTDLLRQENKAKKLNNLLTQLQPFFSLIPKAKSPKLFVEFLIRWPNYLAHLIFRLPYARKLCNGRVMRTKISFVCALRQNSQLF